jgi:RNA polymerase primary sigma factor
MPRIPAGDGAAAPNGGTGSQPPQTATAPAARTPFRAEPEAVPGEPDPTDPPEGELDEDDLENSMSLAAIEADLMPKLAHRAGPLHSGMTRRIGPTVRSFAADH